MINSNGDRDKYGIRSYKWYNYDDDIIMKIRKCKFFMWKFHRRLNKSGIHLGNEDPRDIIPHWIPFFFNC